VSIKDAEKVAMAYQSGEEPSSAVSAGIDQEATVLMHYLEQTKYVLRNRISRLSNFMTSDEFSSACVGCFTKQLYNAGDNLPGWESPGVVSSMAQAKVGFVIKDLLQDILMDRYYDRLQLLLERDVNLLHLEELFDLVNELESLRRDLELGVRCEVERRIAVPSELLVLRKIAEISKIPKN